MQEDFLHYLWQHKKFIQQGLVTTQFEPIEILNVGTKNVNSGPDFFNAKLKIGDQLWAGNVEIHVNSSDWFVHSHEVDTSYDNVILHVVFYHDTEVYRSNNSPIPTLELHQFIDSHTLDNYKELFAKTERWINCEPHFAEVNGFTINNWLERLYVERLEQKSEVIQMLLQQTHNDWEAVLFVMLAKNFGLKVNGDAFQSMAQSFDFSVVRKLQSQVSLLEALFFGQANLLNGDLQDVYSKELVETYHFLKQKYQLINDSVHIVQFFRLRPQNFPTIRLSQLAMLYHSHIHLFSEVMKTKSKTDFHKLFKVGTSSYWETHFSFGKTTKASKKQLTASFVDLLLINTIIPLKFAYGKFQGQDVSDDLLQLATDMPSEKNHIITAFDQLKKVSHSAMQSQALLQMKHVYCDRNQCLRCAIGNTLVGK